MKRSHDEQPIADDTVILLVGGISYSLKLSDLTKFPESFFGNMIKQRWIPSNDEPIVIERNGDIFQFIYAYLKFGSLPRDANGKIVVDQETKAAIRVEADFYQLDELVAQCDAPDAVVGGGAVGHYRVYREIDTVLKKVKRNIESKWIVPVHVSELDSDSEDEAKEEVGNLDQAFRDLLLNVCGPFCMTGKLSDERTLTRELYKSSTMKALNLEELLADATLSPFGKGSETVVDTDVRHSYEIDMSNCGELYAEHAIDVSSFAPKGRQILLKPYKLVIYKEGGHFHEHRDTVRGENHIGTLVLILNSEYTGGELEVTHGGRTQTVTGAYKWVAMYGDCLHKINPVTSGTRVSLIFDIHHEDRSEWSFETDKVWSSAFYTKCIPLNSIPRGSDEAQRAAVIAGMHQQLEGYEAAVICLKHLYPACQANPDFLKGGDQLLYEILRDDFALAVIPATIYRRKMCSDSHSRLSSACCVKPFVNALLPQRDIDQAVAAAELKTRVIMMEALTRDHVIENERIGYTGNESQGEATMYLVAVLQVRRKEL